MKFVDKENVESRRHIDHARNDAPKDDGQKDDRNHAAPNKAFGSRFLPFFKVDDIDNGRDGKKVQKVNANSQAYQKAAQYQPT